MAYEWDATKARLNARKHGVRFEETRAVFDDPYAVTVADADGDSGHERFVGLGIGALGRVLAVVYSYRGDAIRIISARLATPRERSVYEEGLL